MKRFWRWADEHLIWCFVAILMTIFITLITIIVIHKVNMTSEAKAQQQTVREQRNRDALLAQAEAFGKKGIIVKHSAGFCFFYTVVYVAMAKSELIVFGVPCPEGETR